MPPIALITDLGDRDYFVSSMKGVILSINPEAKIVDITHQVPKQDVRTASFILANAAETFPKGSTFVAVVDPGVGTERLCILVRTENELNFIGPDNGVFTLAAEKFGIEEVRKISNKDLLRSDISSTFHGRDVMAPVAAHLSSGLKPKKVGERIEKLELIDMKKPKSMTKGIRGEILHIDDFGNVITNVGADLIEKRADTGTTLKIKVDDHELKAPFVKTFGEVPEGGNLCYIGSSNLLEIAKNRGNLSDEINVERGNELFINVVG
ncbi:hypothetical protein AKJ65_05500 [candidate division MSBL1 archaeon SCGC-AAA259E19]|uniref:Uncharacterized protein n=1 Tax=candidate division MSBL1 archaeon SCGC-AAA259E19 TaxID=1698264 RepID=A0A133UIR0_9EURY|nr:hypothetical protein AKJ65_05500 [candidate division MSBL1 archaeon SCGC-AAA259E19]